MKYLFLCALIAFNLTACTISFSNISTMGGSKTETDEDMDGPDISTDLDLPINKI